MDKTIIVDLNDINPFVRQAGFQKDNWPDHERKIYDYELFYCNKGQAHMTINGDYKHLKKGTLVLIKPNTPTKLWFDKKQSPEIYWIHFDFIYFDGDHHINKYLTEKSHLLFSDHLPDDYLIRPNIMLSNGLEFPDYIIVKNPEEVGHLCMSIINSYKSKHFYWQFDCKIYLLQIFKCIMKQICPTVEPPINTQKDITNLILEYIKNHYYEKLSLEEISNYIGLSKDYISKIFKYNTGNSIITYLNIYRIKKAKQLLKYSNLTIKEISEVIGYNDQYYFSKQMKKLTGYSPISFRKNNIIE
ncbi:hypothetical protein AN1V17_38020 [Vallitalea sediminicola]